MIVFIPPAFSSLSGHLQGECPSLSTSTVPGFCSPEDGGAPAAG